MKFVQKWRLPIVILNTLLIILISRAAWASSTAAEQQLEEYWNRFFLKKTAALVQLPSYREENLSGKNEHQTSYYLQQTQTLLRDWVNSFNEELTNLRLRHFEWNSEDEWEEDVRQKTPPPYKVFGFRLGNGSNKVSLLAHLDVVPPGNSNWQPFDLRVETRKYPEPTNMKSSESVIPWGDLSFIVGRGTIDDKGPAVGTLIALMTLAKQFDDNPDALKDVTLELLFDTSEETDMSTLKYLKYLEKTGQANKKPNLGIVFDGMWCIRAEKGIERPIFSLKRTPTEINQGLWIDSLYSGENGDNPSNQIPDTATAIIKADDANKLTTFCEKITSCYKDETVCPWVPKDEDPYTHAPLTCDKKNKQITLTTKVIGVQHGSGPNENRYNKGANPLVSLTNFLAYLVELPSNSDKLGLKPAENDFAKMARFIRWGWGTLVYGEKHPKLLERHDSVFLKGNGTTYAITKFQPTKNDIKLSIDIRYAINHHINGEWDGTQGFLPGETSKFGRQGDTCRDGGDIVDNDCIFEALVSEFNEVAGIQVQVETYTAAPPDIRDPDKSAEFQKINTAFKDVINQNCPQIAIGGGTDAKGNLQLWAAGALFDTKMGPPINFHGQNEGAPIAHLKIGAKILYRLMCNEISECP